MPNNKYTTLTLAQAKQLSTLEQASLIIGCGRRSAQTSAKLKCHLGANTSNIQILNPVATAKQRQLQWDWLLIPEHDGLRGNNIITFHGALVRPPPVFTGSQEYLVILLGGATNNLSWSLPELEVWLEQANKQCNPVILCPSRRTHPAIVERLQLATEHTANWKLVHAKDYDSYQRSLAMAGEFWVTGDSINMVAEACASSRPLRILGTPSSSGKLAHYFSELYRLGRTSNSQPLQEATRVAQLLLTRGALLGTFK